MRCSPAGRARHPACGRRYQPGRRLRQRVRHGERRPRERHPRRARQLGEGRRPLVRPRREALEERLHTRRPRRELHQQPPGLRARRSATRAAMPAGTNRRSPAGAFWTSSASRNRNVPQSTYRSSASTACTCSGGPSPGRRQQVSSSVCVPPVSVELAAGTASTPRRGFAAARPSAGERVPEPLQERDLGQQRQVHLLLGHADRDPLAGVQVAVTTWPSSTMRAAVPSPRFSTTITFPRGSTSERAVSECGATNVTTSPSRPQPSTGPPADRL